MNTTRVQNNYRLEPLTLSRLQALRDRLGLPSDAAVVELAVDRLAVAHGLSPLPETLPRERPR